MAVEVSPYLLRRRRSLGEVLTGDDKPEQGEGTPPDPTDAGEAQRAAAGGDAALPQSAQAKTIG
jgi:hypothetical protein